MAKTVNSLAIASIKTVNGLASASIKTINGYTLSEGVTNTYLHSYWELDETSGNAINSKQASGYDLTQVGTVGTATGILNTCRGTFSTSNYLYWPSSGSNSTVYDTNYFVFEVWVKTSSTGVLKFIGGKTGELGTLGWRVFMGSDNKISSDLSGLGQLNSTSALADGNWHYVVIGNRASGANEYRLYIDGSLNAQTTGGTFNKYGFDFVLGINGRTAGKTDPFNGYIDSSAYWNTIPSSWVEIEAIITERYNSGNGKRYA